MTSSSAARWQFWRERTGTTVIEPGWAASITTHNHLLLERVQPLPRRVALGTDADPVMLYGALDVMAAAQGTMNDFVWGDDRYQYYETICGGSGDVFVIETPGGGGFGPGSILER